MNDVLHNCVGCMIAAADSGETDRVVAAVHGIRYCCARDCENNVLDSILKVVKAGVEQGSFVNSVALDLYGNAPANIFLSECVPFAITGALLEQYVEKIEELHSEHLAKSRLAKIQQAASEGNEEVVRSLLDPKKEQKRKSYMSVMEMLNLPEKELWLVDKVIPDSSTTILSSPGDTGKSMLSMFMANCISTGADFAGFKVVKPGNVLYLDGENDAVSAARRLRVLGISSASPIYIMTRDLSKHPFDVDDPKFYRDLHDTVEYLNPSITIIDTIRRITSLNISDDKDVNHVLAKLTSCVEGRALFILAHWRKPSPFSANSGGDRLFGSVDFRNFARCHLMLETDRTDQGTTSTLTIDKSNYAANRPSPIRMEWHNKDGKLVFNVVDNGGPSISPQARIVCQVLRDNGPQLLRKDLMELAARRGVGERDVSRILDELYKVGFVTFDASIVNGRRNTLICLSGAATF